MSGQSGSSCRDANVSRNRYPRKIFGGQRQRVGIASALAISPKFLVADEPTSARDVSVKARVVEVLQQVATLFYLSRLEAVDFLGDCIAVTLFSERVEQGDRNQILLNPQHEYTKNLIAAVPVPDPKVQR